MTAWHVPPRCQGQIVEVAYALVSDGERLLRRTTDRSDGSVAYDEIALDDDEIDIEPWNEEPSPRGEWRSIDASRVQRLMERS